MRKFGFLNFIREQGVVGLAVGFAIGGGVSKLVTSFATDIVNPSIAGLFGLTGLQEAAFEVGEAKILWGSFVQR